MLHGVQNPPATKAPLRQPAIASPIVRPVRRTQPAAETPSLRRLPFTERAWIPVAQMAVDVAAIHIACAIAVTIGYASSGTAPSATPLVLMPLPMTVAWVLTKLAGRLYPGYGIGSVQRVRWLCYGAAGLIGCAIGVAWLMQPGALAVAIGSGAAALSLAVLVGVQTLGPRLLLKLGCWGRPVIIFGAGESGATLVHALQQAPRLGLVPVAIFDDKLHPPQEALHGVPVNRSIHSARRLCRSVSLGFVARPSLSRGGFDRLGRQVAIRRLVHAPDMRSLPPCCLELLSIERLAMTGADRQLSLRWQWRLKRGVDLAIALPLLLIAVPVLLAAALAIRIISPGPVVFRHARVGLGGQSIGLLKLRTMHVNAEEMLQQHLDADPEARQQWARNFKLPRDPRIIPGIGRLLRSTSLDEVPQLWNVVRGQLSLVGPRPLPPYHLSDFSAGFRARRRSVPPGLTGIWQIYARANGDRHLTEALDSFYLREWSPWLDFYLLCKTIPAVLQGRGAR